MSGAGFPEIVLASASPRRAALLRQIGLEFDVIPSRIEEGVGVGDPAEVAEALALSKAEDVAGVAGRAIVIGADTVVAVGGEILGKPIDCDDARRMLERLSGRVHSVVTGIAVIDAWAPRTVVDHEETRVWFKSLDPEEIDLYVESGEPLDKAGAYGIQGLGSVIVERIEGCYFNVVGLPLPRLSRILRTFGIDILKGSGKR